MEIGFSLRWLDDVVEAWETLQAVLEVECPVLLEQNWCLGNSRRNFPMFVCEWAGHTLEVSTNVHAAQKGSPSWTATLDGAQCGLRGGSMSRAVRYLREDLSRALEKEREAARERREQLPEIEQGKWTDREDKRPARRVNEETGDPI